MALAEACGALGCKHLARERVGAAFGYDRYLWEALARRLPDADSRRDRHAAVPRFATCKNCGRDGATAPDAHSVNRRRELSHRVDDGEAGHEVAAVAVDVWVGRRRMRFGGVR